MKDLVKNIAFLQGLIDALPAMLFIVDQDVRIIHMNRAASDAIGSRQEEVLLQRGGEVLNCICAGETPEGCGHAQHCPECVIRNAVYKAFAGTAVYGEAARMKLSRDGCMDEAFFNVTATPFSFGESNFALLVLHDVTAQKKTEEALNMAKELLERQAMTDPLTGIYNRLKFDECLIKEMSRSRRHKIPLSLVMFDIDHFKVINDTYGHHVGDDVLKQLTAHVSKRVRKHDYFARWGGEEFMILLTHNKLDTAVVFAEHLRSEIEALQMRGMQRITCSFGVAQLEDADDVFSFAKRTDEALYRAKESGRNRVERSQE